MIILQLTNKSLAITSGKSFINIKYIRGLSTDPWGTPLLTSTHLEAISPKKLFEDAHSKETEPISKILNPFQKNLFNTINPELLNNSRGIIKYFKISRYTTSTAKPSDKDLVIILIKT